MSPQAHVVAYRFIWWPQRWTLWSKVPQPQICNINRKLLMKQSIIKNGWLQHWISFFPIKSQPSNLPAMSHMAIWSMSPSSPSTCCEVAPDVISSLEWIKYQMSVDIVGIFLLGDHQFDMEILIIFIKDFFGLLQCENYLNPTHLWHFWFDWIDKRIAAKDLVNLRRHTAFLYHNVCHLLLDETRLKKSDMDCWFTREKLSPLVFFWCSLRTPLILLYFHVVSYLHLFLLVRDLIIFMVSIKLCSSFFCDFLPLNMDQKLSRTAPLSWRDSPGYNALLSACDRAAETRQAMPGSSDSPWSFGWRWEKSGNVSQQIPSIWIFCDSFHFFKWCQHLKFSNDMDWMIWKSYQHL